MSDLASLNQKCRREIRPLLEMLKHRKAELTDVDWINLVRQTEEHIIKSPDQYLSEVSQKEILSSLIHNLFNEFLTESTPV